MSNSSTILFIEDDELLASTLAERLTEEGYVVLSASTALEAKKQTEGKVLAAIVTDVTLPDGNGLEVAKDIRESLSALALPIVLLTNNDSSTLVHEASETANVTYILKAGHMMADIVEGIKKAIGA